MPPLLTRMSCCTSLLAHPLCVQDWVHPAAFTDSASQPLTGANGNTYTWTIAPSAMPIYTNRTGWCSFIAYDSNVGAAMAVLLLHHLR